ncbi:hypothetical protein N9Z47_00465 [bacterium]|nr:hypothetical protein [bacterium]
MSARDGHAPELAACLWSSKEKLPTNLCLLTVKCMADKFARRFLTKDYAFLKEQILLKTNKIGQRL